MGFVLYYSGFLYLYSRLLLKRRLTILFYHEVGDVPALGAAAMNVNAFKRQMELVARWYRPISIDELHDCLAGNHRLPDHPLLVTFDGGYRGVIEHALTILRRYHIPATIYLVTSYIDHQMTPHVFRVAQLLAETDTNTLVVPFPDGARSFSLRTEHERRSCCYALMKLLSATPPGDRNAVYEEIARRLGVDPAAVQHDLYLTWEEIAASKADGLVRFESHSLNHPNLTLIPEEEARREIGESKEAIELRTGRAVTSFCYPKGYYSARIKLMVREAGYRSAMTVRYGLNRCCDDPLELKRIAARDTPLCVFATELCGVYRSGAMMEAFDRLKSRLKHARR